MTLSIYNIAILAIQKIAFSVNKICGCINGNVLELMRIYLSYLERGLEIPALPTKEFAWFDPFTKNNSRYSIMIGEKVLWIVDDRIFEDDMPPIEEEALPDFIPKVTFFNLE